MVCLKHWMCDCDLQNSIQTSLFSEGLLCSVNNRGRVEHHGEFWVLVAGQELDWLETGDTEAGANLVSLPGARAGGECVGMFGDIVGTVNKCRVGISMRINSSLIMIFTLFSACSGCLEPTVRPSSGPHTSASSPRPRPAASRASPGRWSGASTCGRGQPVIKSWPPG